MRLTPRHGTGYALALSWAYAQEAPGIGSLHNSLAHLSAKGTAAHQFTTLGTKNGNHG